MRLFFLIFFFSILFVNGAESQIKYLHSREKSAYAASYARIIGPNKGNSTAYSVATGGGYAEVGLTHLNSVLYYGEYNDQKTEVSGVIPSLEFFYERPDNPLILGITFSYSALRGENYQVPFKHVVVSPSLSFKIIRDPSKTRFSIIPEVGFSQMITFSDGDEPDPTASIRLLGLFFLKSSFALYVAGEHARNGDFSANGLYLGLLLN